MEFDHINGTRFYRAIFGHINIEQSIPFVDRDFVADTFDS